MKNNLKTLLLLFAVLLAGCKNPFKDTLESIEVEEQPLGKKEKNTVEKEEVAWVQFKLKVPVTDLNIKVSENENKVSLYVDDVFDSYWWLMGDKLLCEEEVCILDFSNWVEACYPVVLYAVKNQSMYSGIVYLTFQNGTVASEAMRTIIPAVNASMLTDIQVLITELSSGKENASFWNSSTELGKNSFALTEGNYSFYVTARCGALVFSGNYAQSVENGKNQITVKLELEGSCGTAKGSLIIEVVTENTGSIDIGGTIYACNEELICCGTKSVSENRLVFEDLESGLYWLRIDASDNNGKLCSYYVAYVQIYSETECYKTVELKDFWNIFTVTYELEGGFWLQEIEQRRYAAFETVTLPEPECFIKPGFVFEGWYLNEEKPLVNDFLEAGEIAEDVVLHAVWSKGEEEVEAGAGLLSDSRVKLFQQGNYLVLWLPEDLNCSQFIFELSDAEGNQIAMNGKTVSCFEGRIETRIKVRLEPEKLYMLEIHGINYDNGTAIENGDVVFYEKQLLKALCN